MVSIKKENITQPNTKTVPSEALTIQLLGGQPFTMLFQVQESMKLVEHNFHQKEDILSQEWRILM